MPIIEMENVTKTFDVYHREKGFVNTLKSIVKREYIKKTAVNGISFKINKGELVGYIGANGAGKSTTIKMLAGVLVPTSGTVRVSGKIPYQNRRENAKQIGVVFGQRSQLYWSLPIIETFELYKRIYNIPTPAYKQNVDFFIDLLELEPFFNTPVRQLSLGQRMRAELATALLHDPEVLYLDEPTIGLDVMVKNKLRAFIKEINRQKNVTVILTTHDMDDIEHICDRIITIDKGNIIYDGTKDSFKETFGSGHLIEVEFYSDDVVINNPLIRLVKDNNTCKSYLINPREISVAEAVSTIARQNNIKDIKLQEPTIEDAVKKIHQT